MPQRAHRVFIPLAALLATLPILIHGPSCGHDFDFHLLSWLEASTQFAHFGFPHWAYTPAWNAGEPRFIFYPPLSWTLGGVLGLIVPWTLVPAIFTWICLTLSGLTAHHLARQYANPTASLLAATLYLANPYMLFTAYERTAYGELLAAAWLPLLFAAALGAPHLAPEMWDETTARVRRKPHPILAVAIPITLLWLTNAPAAVMGCYALAFLTAVRLVLRRHSERSEGTRHFLSSQRHQSRRLALTTTTGTLLGLLLAAFYILPAAYERRYVQTNMAVIPGMRPAEHFLFHRILPATADNLFHDAVVRTASFVALILLAAIAVTLLSLSIPSRHPERSKEPPQFASSTTLPLFALTLLIAFLLTPPSQFLWTIVPQLHYLQFPWRLCALLATILCILTAQAVSRLLSSRSEAERSAVGATTKPGAPGLASVTWGWANATLALAAILIFPAWHLFHQPCDDEDNVTARVALFHSNLGTDPTDEYTPANVDPDALHPNNPPYWLIPAEVGRLDLTATADAHSGQAPNHMTVTIPKAEYLVLNRRAYPGWRVTVRGRDMEVRTVVPSTALNLERQDGLIIFKLQPGTNTIDLHFDETPDRLIGLAISGLTLTLTLLLTLKRRKPTSVHL